MDGDGQHLPTDMKKLLYKAGENREALILGVRQVGKKMPFRSRVGNTITRTMFHLLSGLYVSDTQSGLRAFSTELADQFLEIPGERYEYETAVLYQCAKEKVPVKEIRIRTIYKDTQNSTSHFRTVRDSVRIYGQLFKFVLASLSSFCLDYCLFGIMVFFLGTGSEKILAANIAARMLSGTYNYLLNTRLVFRQKPSVCTAWKYCILAGSVLVFNNIFLSIYTVLTGLDVFYAKILTEITLFLVSFLVQRLWIFVGLTNKCQV